MAKSTAILPEQQNRIKIYEAMTPSLRKVADTFMAKQEEISRTQLLDLYDSGEMIKDIMSDEAKYGAGAIEQLAEYFGTNADNLYARRNITKNFTRQEIEDIAGRQTADGQWLTPTHLRLINMVSRAGDRSKLLERVFSENLSSRELQNEISAAYDTTNASRKGGRKPSVPGTPLAAAQDARSRLQQVNNRFSVWDTALFDAIDELSANEASDVLINKLKDLETQVIDSELKLTDCHSRVRKGIERLEMIAAQAKKLSGDTDTKKPVKRGKKFRKRELAAA